MVEPNVTYPDPPEGYQPAVVFQYPRVKLQIIALALLVSVVPGLFALVRVIKQRPVWEVVAGMGWFTDLLIVLLTVLVTLLVHELVHGMVYRLLGYRVSYGVSLHLLAAYAAVFDQWQKRNHNMAAALAPLVVLTVLLVPLLAAPQPGVVLAALAALLMNIGGSVGDLYLTWRLLRLPRATLLYDIDPKTMLIYEPVTSD